MNQEPQLAGKRNLVVTFLTNHPKAIVLLWTARKRAREISGTWKVVYIETIGQHNTLDPSRQEQVLNLLTRAKQMGAETEHIEATSQLKGAEDYLAREAPRIASVIIGSTGKEHWLLEHLRSPQWVKLVQLASHYTKVESLPLTGYFRQPWRTSAMNMLREVKPLHVVYGLLAMLIPSLFAVMLQHLLPPVFFRINEQNIDNLFLIAIALVAGRFGLAPGLFAAIAGFLIENYYFTLPYNQFKLSGATNFFSMCLFLSAAVLIAVFTSRMRSYAQKVKRREMHTEMLFTLYRLTAEAFTREQAIETLQKNLEQMLRADVAIFLPKLSQSNELEAAAPVTLTLSENDTKALNASWSDMKSTGAASPYNQSSAWRFEPMVTANGEVGVLGVRPHHAMQLDAWFGRLLTAAADQTAAILSHIELERSMEAKRMGEEREKLRVMLLSSVSHDLKTPLAGIIGSLSAFLTLGHKLKPEQNIDLIKGSLEEAQSLNSFITNILDMTRLETGNIKFGKEWIRIRELTDNITKRLSHRLKQRKVAITFPESDVEASMDNIMTGQVLQNLIENACKYTPADTEIDINWEVNSEGGVTCSVRDHGKGIPTENLYSIFDKYTRLHKKDTQTPGTGLGLAIAKAIIEAQGGWIKASNHPDGGAVFTFSLPNWRSTPAIISKEESHAAFR